MESPQQNARHTWRRRETLIIIVCGVLGFLVTVSILIFGGNELSAWLTHFNIDEHPSARRAAQQEPPPRLPIVLSQQEEATPLEPRARTQPQEPTVSVQQDADVHEVSAPPSIVPLVRTAPEPVKKAPQPVPKVPPQPEPALQAPKTREIAAEEPLISIPVQEEQTKALDVPEQEYADIFPAFVGAVHPVSRVPNWGAMYTSAEWDRSYHELQRQDFVSVPRYDLKTLTIPVEELMRDRANNIAILTAKLYYSTRFFGTYDLDAGEFSGNHPGIDLKLALGTPIGSIGGGRVQSIVQDQNMGLHVIVEHRIPDKGTFYSIYGHLGAVAVQKGQDVSPGTVIGTVGMTGKTTAPHLHLQIDRGEPGSHERFWPGVHMAAGDALERTVHPVHFIARNSAAAMTLAER